MTTQKPKVIYAWNYVEWGGVQIYFISLIKEVRKSFDVVVFVPENSDTKLLELLHALDVEVRFTEPVARLVLPTGMFDSVKIRARMMKSENGLISEILGAIEYENSIVHADLGFWQSLLPIFRLSRRSVVFLTQHTPLKRQPLLREIIWKVRGRILSTFGRLTILAENNDARSSLARYVGKRLGNEVHLTYGGFDPEEIARVVEEFPGEKAIRQKYAIPEGHLFITVGQFIERKGCWTVMEAIREMSRSDGGFTFLWIATAPVEHQTAERIREFEISDSFRLISASELDNTRIDPLMLLLSSDAFVLASLEEGLPLALIEAMALARPCIVTNVNAIPEAIEDGRSGLFIKPGDPGSLIRALKLVTSDPELGKRLGAQAKVTAIRRFNEKNTAAATIQLYEQALGRSHS